MPTPCLRSSVMPPLYPLQACVHVREQSSKKNKIKINHILISQSESHSVVPDSLQSHGLYSPGHWSGWPFPSPGDLPNPGIKPRSPSLQVDSLPAEPPKKPKNIGVGSLSLLQGIFLTQESNHSLLHCR